MWERKIFCWPLLVHRSMHGFAWFYAWICRFACMDLHAYEYAWICMLIWLLAIGLWRYTELFSGAWDSSIGQGPKKEMILREIFWCIKLHCEHSILSCMTWYCGLFFDMHNLYLLSVSSYSLCIVGEYDDAWSIFGWLVGCWSSCRCLRECVHGWRPVGLFCWLVIFWVWCIMFLDCYYISLLKLYCK